MKKNLVYVKGKPDFAVIETNYIIVLEEGRDIYFDTDVVKFNTENLDLIEDPNACIFTVDQKDGNVFIFEDYCMSEANLESLYFTEPK